MARRNGTSSRRKAVAAEVERKCADLAIDGWSERAIAEELGMSPSGVHGALTRFRENWSAPSLEAWRQVLIERYEKIIRVSMKDVEAEDRAVRDQAHRRILRANDSLARVTGVERIPAPVVVNINAGQAECDLSKLSVEELHQFKALRMKATSSTLALPPAIEAHGHEVLEPKEHDDDDERSGDSGEG